MGGQYGVPHGLVNAVIMPYVLEVYGDTIYKKLHELGVAAGGCTVAQSDQEGAEIFINAIQDMNRKLGIPNKIKGIERQHISAMARYAEKEANPWYPVPKLMTATELEELYFQIADFS